MSKVKPLKDVLKAWDPTPRAASRKMTTAELEAVFDRMVAQSARPR